MEQPKGQEVRNEKNPDRNSPEQEHKVDRKQDIEPQAEKWNTRNEISGTHQDENSRNL
ncbi:hypothetical protein [Paenibacillus sp. 1P03SA]|uniref:hypothetical protein n=1 Tax=Paenibacillus sp. 1P03SA TaxID=3132294 RepID=UPI00399F3D29